MTDQQHRATPEQWELIDDASREVVSASCLLELRDRIEELKTESEEREATNLSSFCELEARIAALEANQFRDATEMVVAPSAPYDSLVERVADAIYRNGTGDGFRTEARAAIREVAAWLKEQERRGLVDLSEALEQEAER
jgi:hypothetical protein